ncbi:MAG: tRNA modification GTPase [Tenacibaculum sp.]
MKKLLSIAFFIATLNSYSQINFEKGYFIDNNGKRTECLIKNSDWKNNPDKFIYKSTANSSQKTSFIDNVKEFGIYNASKFIRKTVQIDIPTTNINKISTDRRAKLKTQTLFLKALIEGSANLYSFENNKNKVFFYSTNKKEVEQLIFKKFKVNDNYYSNNERYKQQLFNNLKCGSLNSKNLSYKTKSLTRFFIKYNSCNNSEVINFSKSSEARKKFNLSVLAGVNNTSLNIQSGTSSSRNTDFGSNLGLRFSVEGEYILPFNKNKWSVVIAPTYQSFSANKSTDTPFVVGGVLKADVKHNSIEIPIGIRHSFYLNDVSKIFLTGSYIVDFSFDSNINFKRIDDSSIGALDINSLNSFAVGVGYKYQKFIIDFRYSNKNILQNFTNWNSKYSTLSLSLGYTIF